jgi:CheY-like chemotaxis protein
MAHPNLIVVAEDNLADVELTKIALADLNLPYKVVHAADGLELLEYLQTAPLHDIAFVLLDLNMPRKSGLDVLRERSGNEQLSKIPVVVFTSSTHHEDIRTAYQLGANAFTCKPIDIDEYTHTIKALVDFWGELNLRPSFQLAAMG